MRARFLAAAAFAACALATITTPACAKDAPPHPAYLDPALFDVALDVPAPPARGSAEEARELDALRRLIAGASKARLAQARADGENETPTLFNQAVGVDLKTLPATWALLTTVQEEANAVAVSGKDLFHRMRPYSIDPALGVCGQKADPAHPKYRSYPSGHSMLGYSVGWMLARLMPTKAGAILARAHDYALSRQYCGGHFASDTEASHVIGTLAAATLFNDPRLSAQIAAARAELAKF
jgi:acid phosphatase (class A)